MQTASDAYTTLDHGWIVRIQPPKEVVHPRTLLLLHGWTGDEKVMWIFTRNLPKDYWMIAPRAPVQAPEGGYGWLPHTAGWPSLADFEQVAGELKAEIQRLANGLGAPQEPLDVMGFSQGAAMAYALAAYNPGLVGRVIALAGFLPPDDPMPGRYQALHGKQIYIAHGIKDETVPVQLAQQAVRTLQAVGANVTYCESDVGHKLNASCLKGLESFTVR